ncbi:hypothetical protein F0562_023432 [Nyssa sinensis]|uniref:ZF-HD dimerization-type domain-containing protein n=1 Tax=Nyssa sinensis TaxID=561372 RepID=A0A5J5BL56_9ASTE|nr:hypothetical protein F0562_023432 [Nyssa sinensis]
MAPQSPFSVDGAVSRITIHYSMSNLQKEEAVKGGSVVTNARYKECCKNHAVRKERKTTDGCQEFMATQGDDQENLNDAALTCVVCGCHRNFHRKILGNPKLVQQPASSPSSDQNIQNYYDRCCKNHAVLKGKHGTDGCQEFVESQGEGMINGALKCAACGCHRNFHLKNEYNLKPTSSSSVSASDQNIQYYGGCNKNHAARRGKYGPDGCKEFMATQGQGTSGALTCAVCGCHRNFHYKILNPKPFPSSENVKYEECRKNHEARRGEYGLDGCMEFMMMGSEGEGEGERATSSLTCVICGCHRNFHSKKVEDEVVKKPSSPYYSDDTESDYSN